MHAIEFETKFDGRQLLEVPASVVSQLPSHTRVRVIVFYPDADEDDAWQKDSYAHFLKDDSEEDSIYESLR